jgi:hypothetical protein
MIFLKFLYIGELSNIYHLNTIERSEDGVRVDGASRHAPVVQRSSIPAFQNFFQKFSKRICPSLARWTES